MKRLGLDWEQRGAPGAPGRGLVGPFGRRVRASGTPPACNSPQSQREELEAFVSRGKASARAILHAHILLKVDRGPFGSAWSQLEVQRAYSVGESTIKRVAQRFVEGNLHDAVQRRPQPERPEKRKINGEMEAYLIATTCSPAPSGYQRWSLRLLEDRFLELAPEPLSEGPAPSWETIRRALKKTN